MRYRNLVFFAIIPFIQNLSGHKLVQFDGAEKSNFKKYVENGGFVFVDDCNHDIDGLFADPSNRRCLRCSARKH